MPVGDHLNALSLDELFLTLTASGDVDRLLAIARSEDLGDTGDLTSEMVEAVRGEGATVEVALRARATGVVSGLALAPRLFGAFGFDGDWSTVSRDGSSCQAGDDLLRLRGSSRAITTLERTLLNLVGRLSGVATLTRRYVESAAVGGSARVCDTRKTTPGMRGLEKYAVRCGGGWLHRIGLFDAVLVKDNHLAGLDPAAVADLAERVGRLARERLGMGGFVEIEVDTLDQFEALARNGFAGVDVVLLDNMSPSELSAAVRTRGNATVELEASGGVTLETIGAIAASGVDRISVGAMTHGATSLDVGLDAL